MNQQKFETAIEKALGEYAVSHDNPCGGTGYVDEGEGFPYRVLFCDGVSQSYATAKEAIKAAKDYVSEFQQ